MKYLTILDATRAWVREFNAYPLNLITKLFKSDVDDWHEITPIAINNRVFSCHFQESGQVIDIKTDETDTVLALVELDNGENITIEVDALEVEHDDFFPMWGTMWTFGESLDDEWLTDHLQDMANCGFRIYESEEFGYYFGIDGCGYDFYESHWIPLYKKRGLKWHETVKENN